MATDDAINERALTSKERQTRRDEFFLRDIDRWIRSQITDRQLARRLGVNVSWVERLKSIRDAYQDGEAARSIKLEGGTVGDRVALSDSIVVVLDSIKITSLFTDKENLLEIGDLEGAIWFVMNGQTTSIAWRRLEKDKGPFKKTWHPLNDTQPRVIYAGQPKGILDIDANVVESDEPEREFFQKIADLLTSAAAIAGLVPVYGTAVSAGLALGAAVAELIKAKIDDDNELQFLTTLSTACDTLNYGDYTLTRSIPGEAAEIEMKFRIRKFVPAHVPHRVMILLDGIEFKENGGTIQDLKFEDRVKAEVTITRTPIQPIDPNDPSPLITTLKIDRAYFAENEANWTNTFAMKDKLLYDGPWGVSMAFAVNLSGIPHDIDLEEWMAVVQKTGALIAAVVPADQKEHVSTGFAIAESVSATVVKFLPKTRFVSSLSSMFVVGDPPAGVDPLAGLVRLQQIETWQDKPVTIQLGNYGKAKLNLKVKLTLNPPPPVPVGPEAEAQ